LKGSKRTSTSTKQARGPKEPERTKNKEKRKRARGLGKGKQKKRRPNIICQILHIKGIIINERYTLLKMYCLHD